MKTSKIIVSGIVQGVGFRYFTINLARKVNVKGWVRNNSNGSVEMIVSGEDHLVDEFTSKVILGNQFSSVEGVDIQSLDYRKFDTFELITAH